MYLPEIYTHETTFPAQYGKDLFAQIRLINERYRRMYPKIEYFQFRGSVAADAGMPGDVPGVVGVVNGSAFDGLWGETVPQGQAATGEWQQPHDGSGAAADPEIFYEPVIIHGRIQREAKEKELKRYGFDQIRDLLLFFPTAKLDELGVSVRAGDEFIWDGFRYVVKQTETTGYWKNTNLRLYAVMNCEQKKAGA